MSQFNIDDLDAVIAEADSSLVQMLAMQLKRQLQSNFWPHIQGRDLDALLRFNETCEDGEGYDIGDEAMRRLVEIGLASKGPHGIRNITPFGQWVIDASNGEVDLEPLKTEEDHFTESALRMAELRDGSKQ